MLITRRFSQHLMAMTAELLSRQAPSLIAVGRTDVHQSLRRALEAVATRLQADDDPDVLRLGVAVAAVVQAFVHWVVSARRAGVTWATMEARPTG